MELNVMEQVRNLAKTNIIQNALRGDNPPRLHGLVYDIADGVLKDLELSDATIHDLARIYSTEAPATGARRPYPPAKGQAQPSRREAGFGHRPGDQAGRGFKRGQPVRQAVMLRQANAR
ncbi:MAG: hypothetical protein WKG07_48695 [Hymenobacter sp.]